VNSVSEQKEAVMTEVVLGETDSGRQVETAAGSRVLVRLPENPSTGYRWQLEPFKGDAVRLESDDYQHMPSASVPGAGGVRIFTFLAQSPGTVLLRLRLKRPWESKAADAKTFEVTVQVMQQNGKKRLPDTTRSL
jgi:inhibitor of cysteine peptidase